MVLASLVSRWHEFPFDSQGADSNGKNFMTKPYANVIRMHILIFIIAPLAFAGVAQYAIYPALAAYFVPWGKLKAALKAAPTPEQERA